MDHPPGPPPGDHGPPHMSLMLIPRYISCKTFLPYANERTLTNHPETVFPIDVFHVVNTLEDEVKYFWSQKLQFGVLTFYWIRYYTIFLVLFDVIDVYIIHVGPDKIIIYSLTFGAISLWSIEFVMQLRIYILFNRSKKIAIFNGILFVISIAAFLWILIRNRLLGGDVHATFPANGPHAHGPPPPPGFPPPHGKGMGPPPPSGGKPCPSLTSDSRWAQWVPPTLFEFVLFGMAVYKTIVSSSAKVDINGRRSLAATLLTENLVYFFVATCVLVFNNLIFVTRIPWLGFGPFHAGLGLATGHLLLHLRKFAVENLEAKGGSRMGSRMTGVPNLNLEAMDLPDLPEITP
ncbi:hypothetical protein M413DRAFT_30991 [Hebeloma cylindrosporum]|uniref:Uncharacterized protein n=1 Tax=Hebeloma cylindrosporum TaxID=76867 RepID=A0A0C3C0R8_HEBCY|nr:hypothetical protein M413DRAFT_30991 [Hebeloma cylindrosporum h7]